MKLEQQYKKLLLLKDEINSKLKDLDFKRRKELMLWLTGNVEYAKLKTKDSQLLYLDIFAGIWLEEIKNPYAFKMQGDAFGGIESLEDIERKYCAGKFMCLRVENNMPEECIFSAVNDVIQWQFSAFAIYTIIATEMKERRENVIKIARILMRLNQTVKAIGLLETEYEKYPENDDIILELANCWLEVQQLEKSYEYLCLLKNKTEEINEMITELEKLIENGNMR